MAELTAEQLSFLASQRIPLSKMFDASGMQKRDYAAAMEEVGAYFAYGVTPCAAGSHSLRTKAGHCIQCNTATIAYATRHSTNATVYVAKSEATGLVKVGLAIDLPDRLQKLQDYCYGGASDWQLVCSVRMQQAGRAEAAVHDRLSEHRATGHYMRAGRAQKCYELFDCDLAVAEEAIAAIAPAGSVIWA
jgi:hypothetical protein